jgi:NAD(P)-dependent dehydrogenase (short-subunit alcohol dehydrogenase family)
MEQKLKGRRIAITGAASGIGKGIASLFAEHGASLALLDRNWKESPAHGTALTCDVSDQAAVESTMAEAASALGGLDGLVNAAGFLVMSPFADLTHEQFDAMVAVNLKGPFNTCKAALPYLLASGSATIVNIGSVSSVLPMAGSSGYSASKGGVLMLTKGVALDMAPAIRANTICPGTIKTEMTRHIWENPEHLERAVQRAALKRLGDPQDIARAALFLSCEDSDYMTGTELVVDGGFSWR